MNNWIIDTLIFVGIILLSACKSQPQPTIDYSPKYYVIEGSLGGYSKGIATIFAEKESIEVWIGTEDVMIKAFKSGGEKRFWVVFGDKLITARECFESLDLAKSQIEKYNKEGSDE